MKRSLYAIILILAMAFLVSPVSVSGLSNNNNNSSNDIQNYVNEYASQWMKNMYNVNDHVTVDETVPIYNTHNIITGYSVSFTSNGNPKGYIVLSSTSPNQNDPLVEFSLSGTDLYSQLKSKFQSINSNANYSINKRLYNTYPLEYGVDISDNNKSYVYDTQNSFTTKDSYESKYADSASSAGLGDGFVKHDGPPNGTIATSYNIAGCVGFTPLVMDEMASYLYDGRTAHDYQEGNCGPTCLTNLCKFFHDERGKTALRDPADDTRYGSDPVKSWWYTYHRLALGCFYDHINGTPNQDMGPALIDYATHRGYACTVGGNIGYDWTTYTQTLFYYDEPIMVFVSGYNDAHTEIEGHDIIALGYLRLTDDQRFIRVVTEWYGDNVQPTDDRYCVLNTGTGFTDIQGYPVSIS